MPQHPRVLRIEIFIQVSSQESYSNLSEWFCNRDFLIYYIRIYLIQNYLILMLTQSYFTNENSVDKLFKFCLSTVSATKSLSI